MQDPIADLLTRIRNGKSAKKNTVSVDFSNIKLAIVKVLEEEGYITGYKIVDRVVESKKQARKQIDITLKYYDGKSVISTIARISRPGLRIYRDKNSLPKVLGGLGVAIISTPKGVMSDRKARELGHGGEVLSTVT